MRFIEIAVAVSCICSDENLRPVRFCQTSFPFLREVVENAVRLSPVHPSFRSFSSAFHGSLERAFVYGAFVLCQDFECRNYFALLVAELSQSKEKWRVEAGLRGLSEIVHRFSAQISPTFLEIAFSVIFSLFPEMNGRCAQSLVPICPRAL
jgi:hypothetical protein